MSEQSAGREQQLRSELESVRAQLALERQARAELEESRSQPPQPQPQPQPEPQPAADQLRAELEDVRAQVARETQLRSELEARLPLVQHEAQVRAAQVAQLEQARLADAEAFRVLRAELDAARADSEQTRGQNALLENTRRQLETLRQTAAQHEHSTNAELEALRQQLLQEREYFTQLLQRVYAENEALRAELVRLSSASAAAQQSVITPNTSSSDQSAEYKPGATSSSQPADALQLQALASSALENKPKPDVPGPGPESGAQVGGSCRSGVDAAAQTEPPPSAPAAAKPEPAAKQLPPPSNEFVQEYNRIRQLVVKREMELSQSHQEKQTLQTTIQQLQVPFTPSYTLISVYTAFVCAQVARCAALLSSINILLCGS